MKKFFNIIAFSAITLVVASCSSATDENTPQNGDKAYVKFSAGTESTVMSRANFKDLSGQSAAFKWELNDLVGIYSENGSTLETLTATEVADNEAVLEGNITVGTGYIGVYPKSAVVGKVSTKCVTVNIPANQTIPTTSTDSPKYVDPAAFIQVGFTTSNTFTMATPCAFLKFNTGTNDDITWVKVTAYDSAGNAYGIVGDVDVTKSETSSISLSTGSSSANTVTCTYQGGGAFPTGCGFGIAIRPGNYAKIVVETSDGIKKTATQMASSSLSTAEKTSLNFQRAYYYPMGELQ